MADKILLEVVLDLELRKRIMDRVGINATVGNELVRAVVELLDMNDRQADMITGLRGQESPDKCVEIKRDNVNHPQHYQGKHECIDEMIALFGVEAVKGFCKCNVYKYRYRADRKNGEEDLKKAEWYMDYLMKLEDMTND
jgi:hypothetical protein